MADKIQELLQTMNVAAEGSFKGDKPEAEISPSAYEFINKLLDINKKGSMLGVESKNLLNKDEFLNILQMNNSAAESGLEGLAPTVKISPKEHSGLDKLLKFAEETKWETKEDGGKQKVRAANGKWYEVVGKDEKTGEPLVMEESASE